MGFTAYPYPPYQEFPPRPQYHHPLQKPHVKVQPQKNNYKATYAPPLLSQYAHKQQHNFGAPPPNNYWGGHISYSSQLSPHSYPVTAGGSSYTIMQASQEPLQYDPGAVYYDGTLTQLSQSPPKAFISGHAPGHDSIFYPLQQQQQQLQQQFQQQVLVQNGNTRAYFYVSNPQPLPLSQPMFDPNQGQAPYLVMHAVEPEVHYLNTVGFVDPNNGQETFGPDVVGGVYGEQAVNSYGQSPALVAEPSIAYTNSQQHVISPGAYPVEGSHPGSHPTLQRNLQRTSKPKDFPDQKLMYIKETANNFTEAFCPQLGEQPYCLPPVNRSRHPDKSSKQLVLGMESEKRVLGSFERYFAEQKLPVFMLCHYPVAGFMQVFKDTSPFGRDTKSLTYKSGRDTITLLLLSDIFSVTIVMVGVISGNSDFAYIQRGVQKAAQHMKRCSGAVSQWLKFLGVSAKVREVIAFPNLKKAMMQRITKDKLFQQNYGSLCTLHVDDLSAPFEEEWSTPLHKHLFSEWMQTKVVCHGATLTRDDLHLVVGALLSPRLSRVEFIQDLSSISPIPETAQHVDKPQVNTEDVSQLKLTIDGITKPFDDFMDEYVQYYYPGIETESYRVPPIHFNIQSFKKPLDYFREKLPSSDKEQGQEKVIMDKNASPTQIPNGVNGYETHQSEVSQGLETIEASVFMPPRLSFRMIASKDSNCLDHAGPQEPGDLGTETNSSSDSFNSNVHSSDVTKGSLPKGVSEGVSEKLSALNKDGRAVSVSGSSKSRNHERNKEFQGAKSSSHMLLVSQNPKSNTFVPSPRRSLSALFPSAQVTNRNNSAQPTQAGISAASNILIPSQETGHLREEEGPSSNQLAALQDVEVLSDVMTKDTRADEGENRVISALEMLGQRFGPMFIICGYQYNNYLNKLREEMFSKGEASRPIRAFGQTMRAEHDCLIFHKNYGAIVVCIKAIGDNFSDWGASEEQKIISTTKILEKAVKQLKREEAMIRHVTSDLHSKLACHKLIALPNMTRESVEKALKADPTLSKTISELTCGHGAELFLCMDELPSKYQSVWDPPDQNTQKKLISWWTRVQGALMSDKDNIDSHVYRQIIGRYCGLLSTVEVWSPSNPRVEVRSMSEAASLCAQRFCKVVLLPRQIEALCSNHRRLFLYGPPGCGKTLVLLLKAREWLLAGERVIIVNSRPGSKEGFPYAYGVTNRLKQMMYQAKVNDYKLFMINIDSLKFKDADLAHVLPCSCIIMDEVTPASHAIIEHLCCLQVRYIWCAGLFEDDRPITAHRFVQWKMDKILRCPPIVQSLLKHTEQDVKLGTPYKDIYQHTRLQNDPSAVLHGQSSSGSRQDSDKENARDVTRTDSDSMKIWEEKSGQRTSSASDNNDVKPGGVKGSQQEELTIHVKDKTLGGATGGGDNESTETVRYDADSINKRLMEKYGNTLKRDKKKEDSIVLPRKDVSSYSTSSAQLGLPTDGPRPHIIDHGTHLQKGHPMDCSTCGKDLADLLLKMVRPDGAPMSFVREQQQMLSKNKFAFKNTNSAGSRNRPGKAGDSTIFSNTSAIHTKSGMSTLGQRLFFDSRALTWSDVLIVGRNVQKDCAFVYQLQSRGIPVEVLISGPTHTIETSKEKKLFITSHKEVTGLERALIVFIPLAAPDQLQRDKTTPDIPDLLLGQSLARFTEEDRAALWHVASRSLSSLVLILP